ncbi:hypothetical protein HPB49_019800 [Dermacentor silvarum]|uniref:Uncharacterized protein n=1 Tax=Dermacentor silvarum TaxID=543639 RepID=A0ACB8C574_DERSI|nr:hypothetical protein HPB49_019800 [Dermacentor silvarum]
MRFFAERMVLVRGMKILALATQCIGLTHTPDLMSCSAKPGESTILVTEAEVTESHDRSAVAVVLQVQINAELSSNAEVEVTVDNGINPSCSSESGPCNYKLCDPITDIEEQLFKAFGSQCPIPSGHYRVEIILEETSSPRDADNVQSIIMRLNFTDDKKPVGCTSLIFDGDKITISDMAIQDAQIGKKMLANFTLIVKEPLESNPTLKVTITTAEGEEVGCYDSVGSWKLKLCDGTTRKERKLSSKWDNQCPIEAGVYTVRLSFFLPSMDYARMCLRDGNLVATLKIQDGGETLDCVSYPITVDLNRPELGQ